MHATSVASGKQLCQRTLWLPRPRTCELALLALKRLHRFNHWLVRTCRDDRGWLTPAAAEPAIACASITSHEGPTTTAALHTGSAAQAAAHSTAVSQDAAGGAAPGKHVKRKKPRLDEVCMTLRPELSRNVLQSYILQGKVTIDGKVVTKAGTPVSTTAKVVVSGEELKYVCRAGFKLERALDYFAVDPSGLVCLDSGQSTGGFTDCLLQRGAAHVYGIDVGYGQVADKVRRDPRVTVIERFNVRHLKPTDIPEKIQLVTLDLSFISVLKVVPAVVAVMAPPPEGQMLVLIKPQFEAGRAQVSSGGVVRDPRVHQEVIERVTNGIAAMGFACRGVTESPLKGDKSGNTEFLAHFVRDPSRLVTAAELTRLAGAASSDVEAISEEELASASL